MIRDAEKLKALDPLLKDAGQEAINALGRDLMALLARHGFQPDDGKHPARNTPAKATQKSSGKVWNPPPEGTDAYRVLHAIELNRGLTSADLKKVAESGGKPIHAKTFKTSLRRLRARGFVTRDAQGRWNPAQKKEAAA